MSKKRSRTNRPTAAGGRAGGSGPAGSRKAADKAAKAMRAPRVSTNSRITFGLLAIVLVGLAGLFVYVQNSSDKAQQAAGDRVVRADSHRLTTAGDGKVTMVEFLDFECPSCGQAFPGVEKLRQEYAGKITYVVRNFPLSQHANAQNAARAAEAAARQDKFEQMYVKLFETQSTWGGQQQDQSAIFEGYAQQLGLDLAKFRADRDSQATAARIRDDQSDGTAAGVQSTPSFFVNGQRFDGQPTYAGLKAAVDAALAG
ncbi:thioredoxin domain-containing protein [Micromonospora sp. WMMD1155]|uniref:DsbA family protein n=1 Tax=Micromonospora sp. WMMD1155 TaxID=3016094 RepID=UPI00249C8C32|nr:thioredoxin domain-containing protein [Micromonospora sp. WMMD1155]WFE53130.1 thioredoxin domain-containing protein [Micromonospora sp. WMMD1155]